MKKFFAKLAVCFCLGLPAGTANAADYILINQGVKGSGFDQVKLADESPNFYSLIIVSKGKNIFKNSTLIPKTARSSGGMDIFQGISLVDNNISIRYRFCSPSKGVCYDRNIISGIKNGEFIFLREEAVAFADNIALSKVFLQSPKAPLASLSYQWLLETNGNIENSFNDIYGSCVSGLGGDSLLRISEALEKKTPDSWVLAKGCVTPALVFILGSQNYLSLNGVSNYLVLSGWKIVQ